MAEPSAFPLKACIMNILCLRSFCKACCLGSHRSRFRIIHAGDLFCYFIRKSDSFPWSYPHGDTSSLSPVAQLPIKEEHQATCFDDEKVLLVSLAHRWRFRGSTTLF